MKVKTSAKVTWAVSFITNFLLFVIAYTFLGGVASGLFFLASMVFYIIADIRMNEFLVKMKEKGLTDEDDEA